MKSFWMLASLALISVASEAAEKGKETSAKPVSDYNDSAFVVPLPNDSSHFTVKPPLGGVILNPPLNRPPIFPPRIQVPSSEVPPPEIMPWSSQINTRNSPEFHYFQSWEFALKAADQWKLRSAPLSKVLSQIKRTHNVQILMCFPPEKTFDDARISMILKGKTVEGKLNSLAVIGLVWRKIDAVYYVAWDEKELPITPVPN